MTALSAQLGRQVGVLINRQGAVTHVISGDARGIMIPALDDYPLGRRALRGLRLIHTHLKNEDLSRDDFTDLALLRFDLLAVLGVSADGEPAGIKVAYINPGNLNAQDAGEGKGMVAGMGIEVISSRDISRLHLDFADFIKDLESGLARREGFDQSDRRERAILLSVSSGPRYDLEESMDELKELAHSADVAVLDTVIQRVKEINPRYLLGEGKIKDVVISALDRRATLLIFDQELSPAQVKSISELTELKVIDRSQLILDIFARRAHSREGKVQVELAQLRYRLSRLTGKGTAMSRLMGGIGGRGPGETKLEVDRRRARDRIHLLERELATIAEARRQRKQRRVERGVPVVSIVGYTNAGKSTLLNALTNSDTHVEARMFATLDTASRRLRFPREREIIITDTIGFIRDLPKDLVAAFKSTLEELEDATLILHLVDISNPQFPHQIDSVLNIIDDLGLSGKPRLLVFNKADRLPLIEAVATATRYGAVAVSALDKGSFGPLLTAIQSRIWDGKEKAQEVRV